MDVDHTSALTEKSGASASSAQAMDNFDLSLNMQDQGQESAATQSYLDQTFHTPSFGDEEFEIPPINLQNVGGPTHPDEAATAEVVYGSQPGMAPQTSMAQAMGSPMSGGMMEPPQHSYPGPQGPPDMYHHAMGMPPPPSMHLQSVSSYEGPYLGQYPSPPAAPPPQGALMGPPSMLRGPAPRAGSAGSGSPPGSNHTSPGQETTSEDSDDSTPLSQLVGGVKRPSPEPLMDNGGGKTAKKAKMPKKKKKRDPNEPQKPVSAYALFFRDTQAAIKGQNPNASFGEVSKIVASMWDGLEADHKNVYKKKTEAAKKEYLKALAAYRASLVSKAAADHSDTLYASGPVSSSSAVPSPPQGSLSPLQKKSPLLTSLMEGGSPHNQYMAMSPPQGMLNAQQQVWSNMHPMAQSPSMMQQQPPQQTMMQQHSPPQQMMMASASVAASSYTADLMSAPPPSLSSPASSGGGMMDQQGHMPGGASHQRCIRNGCPNPAIESHDWDREYCSSECVVSHCRDVFTAWVAQRQVANTNTFVK
ncbi:TOX high mobility group box family member 4 isoform X1 [Dermacentor silvarum]|uniref:TOX high mobility group box family member 4 isoform X1 n=3 Tax=Dermacentor silvarum TaxID=543639 RepID=UPI00189BC650|nr:TOX high mobility group box family member 4 isoform X1 [Dermacentor silvarum]